eukprot:TRINITY_DN2318_c0_g2_i1.p1 TRINITY_DN2318_c0_g2~~TRINITY_DN2318_c0_g2_i1.p1  ORF type:complete len:223 (-),score=62.45 TRINITY_DN2318_c0_g2_i1:54-722(-)
MYSNRDKIVKKGDAKVSPTEDEVAKALFEIENSSKDDMAEKIKKIKITKAEKVEDRGVAVLIILVPFALFPLVKQSYSFLIQKLEAKFKCSVVLLAQRTILSKYQKRKGSQKRPVSRTLSAVHDAFLEDIIFPYEIIGRRLRVKTDGTQIHKIHLKEADRKHVEARLQALALAYKKMTNKIITFEFIHVAGEEKKKKRKKESKKDKRRGEKKEGPKAEQQQH